MTSAIARYYFHARRLCDGRFRAIDCLRLAREAAALDAAREARRLGRTPVTTVVWHERQDGAPTLRASRGITVY